MIGNKKEISPDRCEQVMTGWGNFILVEGVRLLSERDSNYALYLRLSLTIRSKSQGGTLP